MIIFDTELTERVYRNTLRAEARQPDSNFGVVAALAINSGATIYLFCANSDTEGEGEDQTTKYFDFYAIKNQYDEYGRRVPFNENDPRPLRQRNGFMYNGGIVNHGTTTESKWSIHT